MSKAIVNLVAEVLERGHDDWVSLSEVEYIVRDQLLSATSAETRHACIDVIEYLLVNNLAEVGELSEQDGEVRFVSWGSDSAAAIAEVEERWSRFGGPRDESGANDVCWISNTKKGDNLAGRKGV